MQPRSDPALLVRRWCGDAGAEQESDADFLVEECHYPEERGISGLAARLFLPKESTSVISCKATSVFVFKCTCASLWDLLSFLETALGSHGGNCRLMQQCSAMG